MPISGPDVLVHSRPVRETTRDAIEATCRLHGDQRILAASLADAARIMAVAMVAGLVILGVGMCTGRLWTNTSGPEFMRIYRVFGGSPKQFFGTQNQFWTVGGKQASNF